MTCDFVGNFLCGYVGQNNGGANWYPTLGMENEANSEWFLCFLVVLAKVMWCMNDKSIGCL